MGAPRGSLAWLLPATRAAQCHCRSPVCLPQPRGMTQQQYIASCLPLAVLVLLCLLQVYMYRLRRAIAAFYFPKVSGGTDPRTPDPAHPQGLQFFFGGDSQPVPGAAGEEPRALPLQQAAAAAALLRPPAEEAHRPAGTPLPSPGERGRGHRVGTTPGSCPPPANARMGSAGCPPLPECILFAPLGWLVLPMEGEPHMSPSLLQGTSLLEWCCRRWPRLRRWVRRPCTVCGEPESPQDHQACPSPACGATYCGPCWRDVGRVCPACTPGDRDLSEDSSEEQEGYAA